MYLYMQNYASMSVCIICMCVIDVHFKINARHEPLCTHSVLINVYSSTSAYKQVHGSRHCVVTNNQLQLQLMSCWLAMRCPSEYVCSLFLQSSDIRTVCAEGFARLMCAGRIISPSLFSRLLLHWYNPVTEDDTRLRQCLGTFFPQYAFASRYCQSI